MKFGTIVNPTTLVSSAVTLSITRCNIQDYYFQNDYLQTLYLNESNIQDKKILSAERQFTVTSSTLTLPMLSSDVGWYYSGGVQCGGSNSWRCVALGADFAWLLHRLNLRLSG